MVASGMAPGGRVLTKRCGAGTGILALIPRAISFKNPIGMSLVMWLMAQKIATWKPELDVDSLTKPTVVINKMNYH